MSFELHSPSEQVATYLREQLYKNRWKNELPGTPTLSAELGVDRKTVIAAIRHLEEEGILKPQGPGRSRKIVLPKSPKPNRLNIRLIPYEDADRQHAYILEILHQVQGIGHNISLSPKSLIGLGMDPGRISTFVANNPADVWLMIAASGEVLEWFAAQETPAFAIFGRRREVKISSVGPDKLTAMRSAVGRLVDLGHHRIVYLAREERRRPTPGTLEKQFLKELESKGIPSGAYNLPDWNDNPDSYFQCLDRAFKYTPPTALIIDEAQFLIAAQHHLAQRDIVAPRDVSIVCCDTHPLLDWCQPEISHIKWEYRPVVNHVVNWVAELACGKNDRKHAYTHAEFIEGGTIGPART